MPCPLHGPSRPGARPEGVPGLPGGLAFGALVGDRASGADRLLEDLAERGAEAAVPSRRSRTAPRAHGRDACGWRHLVENFFWKIKGFRAVATRYEAGIYLVAGVVAAT